MKRITPLIAVLLVVPVGWAEAQQVPSPNISFFVTSTSLGKGGDLGGLEGADRHCQELAQAVGAGSKTWHAYLSTQPTNGVPAVNAKDRIGTGPWYNEKGVEIAANLDDLIATTIRSTKQRLSPRRETSSTVVVIHRTSMTCSPAVNMKELPFRLGRIRLAIIGQVAAMAVQSLGTPI